ncbi:MAG: hypothetical protein JNN20_12995 [Betaproteobacteria bacterium]|nr:hypothetical protein [Betaproteobacteria bacterium]
MIKFLRRCTYLIFLCALQVSAEDSKTSTSHTTNEVAGIKVLSTAFHGPSSLQTPLATKKSRGIPTHQNTSYQTDGYALGYKSAIPPISNKVKLAEPFQGCFFNFDRIAAFTSSANIAVTAVTTTSDCSWSPYSDSSWIQLVSDQPSTGTGVFQFIVAENTTGHSRKATITIGNQDLVVLQSRGRVTESDDCTVLAPPASLGASDFYTKYCSVESLPVLSAGVVPDAALIKAHLSIKQMLQMRPDLIEVLVFNNVRVGIIGTHQVTTDIPEYRNLYSLFPGTDWDASTRGLGATSFIPVSTVAEENLLCYGHDRYFGESILVHEFAHTVKTMALDFVDSQFSSRLKNAYRDAIAAGKWADTYAAVNEDEYWAEGVQSYFSVNLESIPANGIHNHVNTRDELKNYDSTLFNLVDSVFKGTNFSLPCHKLKRVVSRKMHGGVAIHDLVLDHLQLLGRDVTVESRAIGIGHQIIFEFDGAITALGAVTLLGIDATMSIGRVSEARFEGNTVSILLTEVPDNMRLQVILKGVNGSSADYSISIGFLVGDVNNSRAVNASDISGLKARSGQVVSSSNFQFDVNTSGAINATDIAALKARSGLFLP